MSQVYSRGDQEPLSSLLGLRLAHGAKTARQGQALTGAQVRDLDPPAPRAFRMPVGSEGNSDREVRHTRLTKGKESRARRRGLNRQLWTSPHTPIFSGYFGYS